MTLAELGTSALNWASQVGAPIRSEPPKSLVYDPTGDGQANRLALVGHPSGPDGDERVTQRTKTARPDNARLMRAGTGIHGPKHLFADICETACWFMYAASLTFQMYRGNSDVGV